MGLMVWLGINWFIIGLSVLLGPKTIRVVTLLTTTAKFVMLFVCIGLYLGLANEYGVTADGYYWKGEKWFNADGEAHEPGNNLPDLYRDAYNQVFFSLGTCVGVFTAYGSY